MTIILKDCPKGTKLYSPLIGEVTLKDVDVDVVLDYPIEVETQDGVLYEFAGNGQPYKYKDAECMLFPSKDCRDWGQFVPPMPEPKPEPKPAHNFQPFDRVLVRDSGNQGWRIAFFERLVKESEYSYLTMNGVSRYRYCIPYEGNECLVGTSDEPKC